jgi:hypothetical protein
VRAHAVEAFVPTDREFLRIHVVEQTLLDGAAADKRVAPVGRDRTTA